MIFTRLKIGRQVPLGRLDDLLQHAVDAEANRELALHGSM